EAREIGFFEKRGTKKKTQFFGFRSYTGMRCTLSKAPPTDGASILGALSCCPNCCPIRDAKQQRCPTQLTSSDYKRLIRRAAPAETCFRKLLLRYVSRSVASSSLCPSEMRTSGGQCHLTN